MSKTSESMLSFDISFIRFDYELCLWGQNLSLVPIDGRTSRYHEKDLSTVKELFNEKKSVVQERS